MIRPSRQDPLRLKDQLYFKVKLSSDTTIDRSTVLNGIQANPVGVAFDSPDCSSMTVPEPATLTLWSMLGVLGLAVGWWRAGRLN